MFQEHFQPEMTLRSAGGRAEAAGESPDEQVSSDDKLVEIWLDGRSEHTQRAYSADIARFRAAACKPLMAINLGDLQAFADSLTTLAPASRHRALSSLKSLLAFGLVVDGSAAERRWRAG